MEAANSRGQGVWRGRGESSGRTDALPSKNTAGKNMLQHLLLLTTKNTPFRMCKPPIAKRSTVQHLFPITSYRKTLHLGGA